ncbi:hypothetical protein AVEN_25518-1 [Araneus ventricosus]|uniref:Uncharacterized protein n=1 Tax=Araneus ventricosus TaxID=182803 RepID=A0A4Y2GEM2_ARAVE|nr:hypothetical protein AVEN_25518-1 [Araneus ventricosus]
MHLPSLEIGEKVCFLTLEGSDQSKHLPCIFGDPTTRLPEAKLLHFGRLNPFSLEYISRPRQEQEDLLLPLPIDFPFARHFLHRAAYCARQKRQKGAKKSKKGTGEKYKSKKFLIGTGLTREILLRRTYFFSKEKSICVVFRFCLC